MRGAAVATLPPSPQPSPKGNDILDASTPKAFANFSSGLRFGYPEGRLTYGFATLKELPRVSLSRTVATPSELRANIATLTQGFKANPGL